jgi:uncharacterized RDD family membrane protein YckC
MGPVTDIPVGSPPAPPGRHAAPSGWYPDPADPWKERYWDGWQWSRNTREAERPPGPQTGQRPGQGPYPQPYGGYPPAARPGQNAYPVRAGDPQAMTADGVPLASWWWRVLAVVIDSIIVGVIAALPSTPIYLHLFQAISTFFGQAMRAAQAGQPPPPTPVATDFISSTDQLILNVFAVIVGLAYHLLFLRAKAATPGKMLCRLRVVPVDQGQNRAPLPWNMVLVRAALWVLPGAYGLFALFTLIDVLFPLWQPKRQALHDLAAKTQVVKLS